MPEPAFNQRSGNATTLDDSKTETTNFWFRFDSARASEIVVEMSKFQQPIRFSRLFGVLSVQPRGLDSWRRREGSRPLGTRLIPNMNHGLILKKNSISIIRLLTVGAAFYLYNNISETLDIHLMHVELVLREALHDDPPPPPHLTQKNNGCGD